MAILMSTQERPTERRDAPAAYASHALATRDHTASFPEDTSRTAGVVRGLLRIRDWVVRHVGATIASIFLLGVIIGVCRPSWFTSYGPSDTAPAERLQPPSAQHIFGTDRLGRDLFSRVLHGGGATIGASVLALSIAVIAGLLIGVVAGYSGGATDTVLMRFVDVWLAIPGLLLAITIVTAIGFGTTPVAIAIGIGITPAFVRTTRSQVLSIKASPYIEAATAGGSSFWRIILTHVLPNSLGPVSVMALLDFGGVIMGVATLSFLGFGAKPPAPEWGSLINDGRDYLMTAPWISLLPGLVVVLTVLSINILGRALKKEAA